MKTGPQYFPLLLVAIVWLHPANAGEPSPTDFSDKPPIVPPDNNGAGLSPDFVPPARSVFAGPQFEANALVLWDSGGFVTHPGAGVDGSDISMASEDVNNAGDNVRKLEDNDFFRGADRFVLDQTYQLVHISTFGYEPLAAPPTWVSGNMKIWKGFPEQEGSILVFERYYSELDLAFSGVYRILHLGDLDDVRRPVYEIGWWLRDPDDGTAPVLDDGEYWIDWQVVGGQSGWSIYVMEANLSEPDQPVTLVGDSHQLRPVGWTPMGVSSAFRVYGYGDEIFRDRFE